ncbi:MAG: hypothetical protein ACI4D4_06105 [Lachnospira sp.]
MEISPGRVLSSLKLLMAQRHTSDISLGLNNILYISMILQMLQDKTVPSLIKEDKYNELIVLSGGDIVKDTYEQSQNRNYFLKEGISDVQHKKLCSFMSKNQHTDKEIESQLENASNKKTSLKVNQSVC